MTLTTRMADPVLSRSTGVGQEGEAIYLQHFGMKEQPFRLTPGIDCFYEGAERGRLLAAMAYALVHGDGIVSLTGEIGSGKSTLLRIIAGLDKNYQGDVVFAPNYTVGHLAQEPEWPADLIAKQERQSYTARWSCPEQEKCPVLFPELCIA